MGHSQEELGFIKAGTCRLESAVKAGRSCGAEPACRRLSEPGPVHHGEHTDREGTISTVTGAAVFLSGRLMLWDMRHDCVTDVVHLSHFCMLQP